VIRPDGGIAAFTALNAWQTAPVAWCCGAPKAGLSRTLHCDLSRRLKSVAAEAAFAVGKTATGLRPGLWCGLTTKDGMRK